MITTSDLRKGVVIEMDDTLMQVVDWEHIKMGRGSAQVRLKLRDLRGGHTIEKTFQSGSKFRRARIDRHGMQYLYAEGDLHHFMNTESYEQVPISGALVSETLPFLRENSLVEVLFSGDEPIGIELPAAVELEIAESEPGVKGDSAGATLKPAKLETGLTVNVPLFVGPGDVIKVDTRSGEYLERVSTAS